MKKNEHESYWSYDGEKVDYKAADIKYNEIYNIEPSNILTESIFTLCLGFITPHRPVFFKPSEFNGKELLKLLMRNDLEDYEDMLTEFQQRWINGDKFNNPLYRDKFKKDFLEYQIQIVELLMLKRNNSRKKPESYDIDITIKKGIKNHKIHFSNRDFNLAIGKLLESEINKIKMFHSYLPQDEVKKCIVDSVDPEWNLLAMEIFDKNEFNLELEPPIISEDAIRKYAIEHSIKPKVIRNEMLESKYNSLKIKQQALNKPGAHDKNSRKARLALGLIYLYNFKNYWEQSEIKSIYDFPISADIYRFVYDYLNIWGLIEKKSMSSDKELKTNYAKALINNFKSKVDFEYNNAKFRKEYIIDLLHRIKYGESEIDEYKNFIK